MQNENILNVINKFNLEGKLISFEKYGSGHINDTYLVKFSFLDKDNIYILQRLNTNVFKKPEELMKNISNVTRFINKKIKEYGGDPKRETLNLINTKNGEIYYVDEENNFWRCYIFIMNTVCFDKADDIKLFYESGVGFGVFQKLLSDFPANELFETIPDFHNTKIRYQNFKKAVEEDICNRVQFVKDEIDFAFAREKDSGIIVDMLKKGELPLKVTHNDTKLNNILFDKDTLKSVCIIDLDTVMPGIAINDFGDSIRFGANTAVEDETDLSKVSISIPHFEAYTKGFLQGCDNNLTEQELKMLPMSARLITFETGLRFLTDYLQGDKYFKIHKENHNLDRCRNQFALVRDIENQFDLLNEVVEKYSR